MSNTKENIINNPFAQPYNTPFDAIPFDRITVEHFIPALKEGIRREQENIDNICNNPSPATFENTIVAYETGGQMASDVLCAFNAIIYSHSNDKLVEVENELQQLYTEHRNNVTLNEALFERIKSVYNNRPATLTTEQNRLLDDIYTGFVRAGANLKGNEREEYRKLSKKLTLLSLKFQENIIKDTDGFTLLVTREEDIEGLPADLVETAGKSAEESGKEGWLFTLQEPRIASADVYGVQHHRCKRQRARQPQYSKGNSEYTFAVCTPAGLQHLQRLCTCRAYGPNCRCCIFNAWQADLELLAGGTQGYKRGKGVCHRMRRQRLCIRTLGFCLLFRETEREQILFERQRGAPLSEPRPGHIWSILPCNKALWP